MSARLNSHTHTHPQKKIIIISLIFSTILSTQMYSVKGADKYSPLDENVEQLQNIIKRVDEVVYMKYGLL